MEKIETKINNKLKSKIFFYGDKYAKYYDIVEEFTQPQIDLIHDIMIDLLVLSLKRTNKPRILVIGSGTGAEVTRIINRINNANIVTIDFSVEMNKILRSKLRGRLNRANNNIEIQMIEDDFFSDQCEPLKTNNKFLRKKFDVVIAGFLLHHYSLKMKREFYERIFHYLEPDGYFIHADLFAYNSKVLSKYSHKYIEDWMFKQFTKPDQQLYNKFRKIKNIAKNLLNEWVEHWNKYHVYEPLFAHKSVYSLLKDIGFRNIECPFRFYEVGMLWMQK